MVKLKKLYSSLSCSITSFDQNVPQPRCINNASDAKKWKKKESNLVTRGNFETIS